MIRNSKHEHLAHGYQASHAPVQVNQTALVVDVLESDVGPINKASLHLALTVAAFLVEDQVKIFLQATSSTQIAPFSIFAEAPHFHL